MVCYWTYSVKYLIFVEDKLHLGKAIQTSLMSLLSICTIFVEEKRHPGKAIQQIRCLSTGLCIRSVLPLFIGRIYYFILFDQEYHERRHKRDRHYLFENNQGW